MSAAAGSYDKALEVAHEQAQRWLGSLTDRPIPPSRDADRSLPAFGASLQAGAVDAETVVAELVTAAEPGLMAMPSGRFYGWVIGGTLPAALGADWLVSAWDQNATLRFATPSVVAAEETAGRWLLDLLGLPAGSDVGFVTGATMANFTCLAAGRQHVLSEAGWDLNTDGLTGAPRVRVLVGAERHVTVDLALRYLGLGLPTPVVADAQGRIDLDALSTALAAGDGPTIVCLQAGNLHSGAFDAIADAARVSHESDAWVHVDGAFGLWAAASPTHRHLLAGYDAADSWATDAHKTLNVPYDCGAAIVAHPAPLRAAMGAQASYLVAADPGPGDPLEKVPEFSRRARGVPVWAALRSLGRTGVANMVDRFVMHARALAEGISTIDGVEILNEVAFTQICISFGTDERTRAVTQQLLADGIVWMSGSRWQGRDVLRISVSNWSTDDADVAASIDAVRRAAASVR